MVDVSPVNPPVHVTAPYGVVPPDAVRVIVPFVAPKHNTSVCEFVTVNADAGWVMVTVPVLVQPFASAIVYI